MYVCKCSFPFTNNKNYWIKSGKWLAASTHPEWAPGGVGWPLGWPCFANSRGLKAVQQRHVTPAHCTTGAFLVKNKTLCSGKKSFPMTWLSAGCRASRGMNWGWREIQKKKWKCTACGLPPSPNLIPLNSHEIRFCICLLTFLLELHIRQNQKAAPTQRHKMNVHKRDTPSILTKKQDISKIWEPTSYSPTVSACDSNIARACLLNATTIQSHRTVLFCPFLHLPSLSLSARCLHVNPSCWVWLWVMPSHWCGWPTVWIYHGVFIPFTSDRHMGSLEFWATMIYAATHIPGPVFQWTYLGMESKGDQICSCSGLCRQW